MQRTRIVPFSIRRDAETSLTDQVFVGLRHGIAAGVWKQGTRLPTRAELVAALGVSKNVVQAAVARLVREGLIVSHPNRGCIVTSGRNRRVCGRIIEVTPGLDAAYWHSIFTQTLQAELSKGHVSCVSVPLPRQRGRALDFSVLDYEADRGADLIVASVGEGDRPSVWRHLERLGIPFVWRGCRPPVRRSAQLLAAVAGDRQRARADFVDACRRGGIRSVMLLSYGFVPRVAALKSALEACGICVETLTFPRTFVYRTLDDVVQGARDLMAARLRRGALCDLIYSDDDYMTMGAIAALNGRGVRIPADVRLVTLRNKGFGPVLDKSLAAIEYDPAAAATNLSAHVLAWFKTGAFDPPADGLVYVPGDSFPDLKAKS